MRIRYIEKSDNTKIAAVIRKVIIEIEARGKGLGKQMIQRCIDFAKMSNFKQCYIETMQNIQEAQKLYIKVGFKYIDHSLGNTGHSSCPVWMLKIL